MKVFIDDIRNPPDDSWILFRETETALFFIQQNIKEIKDISFDHDMGGDSTTRQIVNWLEEESFNSGDPEYYKFNIKTYVHSANPVGKAYLVAGLKNCTNYQER